MHIYINTEIGSNITNYHLTRPYRKSNLVIISAHSHNMCQMANLLKLETV